MIIIIISASNRPNTHLLSMTAEAVSAVGDLFAELGILSSSSSSSSSPNPSPPPRTSEASISSRRNASNARSLSKSNPNNITMTSATLAKLLNAAASQKEKDGSPASTSSTPALTSAKDPLSRVRAPYRAQSMEMGGGNDPDVDDIVGALVSATQDLNQKAGLSEDIRFLLDNSTPTPPLSSSESRTNGMGGYAGGEDDVDLSGLVGGENGDFAAQLSRLRRESRASREPSLASLPQRPNPSETQSQSQTQAQGLIVQRLEVRSVPMTYRSFRELSGVMMQALLMCRERMVAPDGIIDRELSTKFSRLLSSAQRTLREVSLSLKAFHLGRTRSLRTLRKILGKLQSLSPILNAAIDGAADSIASLLVNPRTVSSFPHAITFLELVPSLHAHLADATLLLRHRYAYDKRLRKDAGSLPSRSDRRHRATTNDPFFSLSPTTATSTSSSSFSLPSFNLNSTKSDDDDDDDDYDDDYDDDDSIFT